MASADTKLITAEEFYEIANRMENRDRNLELEDGVVVELNATGELKGVVCGNVTGLFGDYVRRRKRGRVCCNNMALIVDRAPDSVRGPDISIYTDDKKYAELEREYPKAFLVAIVEALSSHDRLGRIFERIERFLARECNSLGSSIPSRAT